ncbi:MAG: DNA-3-methyladenine glycosylase I [Anaerococcus sp.]|nr:DNA-3-methyladenine glycosylase I [Anaerococcus sp.]MDY2919346.1 DNA-3-methyladenine glycosylase I [Anaerococcus sp.]
MKTCEWVSSDISRTYHDEEYGRLNLDDDYLFEMLVLETMEAGLSFELILQKRDAMREAFDGFDYEKIATYDEAKLETFYENKDLIRNKKKIQAMVSNARAFIKIREDFGDFKSYLRTFIIEPIDYKRREGESICRSGLSERLSKDLKKRGFKFTGPVVIHSFMEAVGLINNHHTSCPIHDEVNKANKKTRKD